MRKEKDVLMGIISFPFSYLFFFFSSADASFQSLFTPPPIPTLTLKIIWLYGNLVVEAWTEWQQNAHWAFCNERRNANFAYWNEQNVLLLSLRERSERNLIVMDSLRKLKFFSCHFLGYKFMVWKCKFLGRAECVMQSRKKF